MSTVRSRRRTSVALVTLTALLLAVAAISGYARSELTDSRAFSERAVSALDDRDVRRVVAEEIVDALSESVAPNALVVRPLVVTGVAALAGRPVFRRVLAAALRDRHEQLVEGEDRVLLELPLHARVILQALRSISPRVAQAIPADYRLPLLTLEPRTFELVIARWLGGVAGLWWPLLAAALLAGAACAVVAGSLREALTQLGIAVAGAGLLVAGAVAVFGAFVGSHAAAAAGLDEDHERRAVGALWSALLGDLRTAGLLAALGGVLVAVLASRGVALDRLAAAAGRLRDLARSPAPAAGVVRAGLLMAAGAALVLEPGAAVRAAAVLAGVALALAGAAQLAGRLSGARRAGGAGAAAAAGSGDGAAAAEGGEGAAPAVAGPRRASPLLLGGVVVAVVAGTVVAIALVLPAPHSGLAATLSPAGGCNGSRALCGRRLSDVVFPSTHNSYAAANEPGWFFANQRHGIARQLRDGIRGFLIDVHFGVRDPARGRVRTDLAYEGSSRNKVAAQLSPQALRTADRLAGRVGAGSLDGPRRPYLCHTLCELGAEPLAEQLGLLRRHLDANPDDVLVVFVEPYVPVGEIERAMEASGLLRYAAELRRDEPLPTLGELVDAGRRLVVLAEQDGGSRPWYHDGFAFAQDTDYRAATPGELRCERFRGSADSPLFLVNHWIATFPPSPRRNRRIGGPALQRRLLRCERERELVANLPAVDFYDRSDVVRIAARLNARDR